MSHHIVRSGHIGDLPIEILMKIWREPIAILKDIAATVIQKITRSFHPRMVLGHDRYQFRSEYDGIDWDTRRHLASARNYAAWDRANEEEGWPSEGDRWRVWMGIRPDGKYYVT